MSAVRSREVRSRLARRCAGCERVIPEGAVHLVHTRLDGMPAQALRECLACAARNGRGPLADPAAGEQPLDLEGIA